jgi:hypothetical protein
MTDMDVVRIARKIDRLNFQIRDLVSEIENSDHPNREDIVNSLRDNAFDNISWATHCIYHFLEGWYPTDGPLGVTRLKSDSLV